MEHRRILNNIHGQEIRKTSTITTARQYLRTKKVLNIFMDHEIRQSRTDGRGHFLMTNFILKLFCLLFFFLFLLFFFGGGGERGGVGVSVFVVSFRFVLFRKLFNSSFDFRLKFYHR